MKFNLLVAAIEVIMHVRCCGKDSGDNMECSPAWVYSPDKFKKNIYCLNFNEITPSSKRELG